MPDAIPLQNSPDRRISSGEERRPLDVEESKTSFEALSTLERLPGHTATFGAETTGEELGQLFSANPDLPGAIIFSQEKFVGVISQAHFYKCISRAFGREIYYRRPAVLMLEEMEAEPLLLESNDSIQHAVEQCLDRSSDFIYEPFIVREQSTGEYRLCAFQDLLLASSQLAALRSQQMEQILNSVTDGLLVIDKDFRIGSEYSKMVGTIFERSHLKNVSLSEVLQPLLDTVTYEQLHDYLKILFDPKLIDRLIRSINPARQIAAHFAGSGPDKGSRTKHFSLNFERIRTQAEISQVLVRIEDITQRINLARELAQQKVAAEEKLQLVMQLLQVEPAALRRFLTHFEDEVSGLRAILSVPEPSQNVREIIHSLFRTVHTLKGEALLLGLAIHGRVLHQVEDELTRLRSDEQLEEGHLPELAASADILEKLADRTRTALEQLKSLHAMTGEAGQPSTPVPALTELGVVETLSKLIHDLSEQLGKPTAFHSTIQEKNLPEAYTAILREVLVHLARNSMVHGIESIEARTAQGKNGMAVIQLGLRSHPQFLELVFQDDGRGLNYRKIQRRAEQLGWSLRAEDELREAIFEPGFSTADDITDLAGRGVGLDAVRHALQKIGGRIIPHSQEGAYCAFQILLPSVPPNTP